ncbi:predicted protein [Sclerotinia sclerotiorum 1980 UF-70]|uniref:Uncharacterized protein n=1 Tax=Sclerotinia sclerotiorum (strain ATCC 18683 / 1980 / Ss-1) TaxID=665079 RepID=A7ER55_SCLS1|nr:predicted protein [Sclerotinia sclerotiorum 1980 UF-70]EDN91947.1 predicted protein [Sclerotinia sclerotiorum 1980 UF-70]
MASYRKIRKPIRESNSATQANPWLPTDESMKIFKT